MNRGQELDVQVDTEFIKEAEDVIKIGQRTATELMFLEGLIQSFKNPSDAINTLNSHITQMSQADLTQDDIEPNVWKFVSKVLGGEKLR